MNSAKQLLEELHLEVNVASCETVDTPANAECASGGSKGNPPAGSRPEEPEAPLNWLNDVATIWTWRSEMVTSSRLHSIHFEGVEAADRPAIACLYLQWSVPSFRWEMKFVSRPILRYDMDYFRNMFSSPVRPVVKQTLVVVPTLLGMQSMSPMVADLQKLRRTANCATATFSTERVTRETSAYLTDVKIFQYGDYPLCDGERFARLACQAMYPDWVYPVWLPNRMHKFARGRAGRLYCGLLLVREYCSQFREISPVLVEAYLCHLAAVIYGEKALDFSEALASSQEEPNQSSEECDLTGDWWEQGNQSGADSGYGWGAYGDEVVRFLMLERNERSESFWID
jgi:hypothetical protein